MSQFCPLCGKNKNTNSVFCDDCKKKIENEYEVEVPESLNDELENIIIEHHHKENTTLPAEPPAETETTPEDHIDSSTIGKRKSTNKLFGLVILIALLVLGFLYYGYNVRQNSHDRLSWDAALKANSITGYIAYMLEFPKGKYYDLAEENIMQLKRGESDIWLELQSTDNSTELRDYIKTHPQSSYIPLIKKRLDSLEWIASLKDNSFESYSKYKEMVQQNDFAGIYIHEAENRFQMLNQTYPLNQTDLDSLRKVADGFFTALSSLNADDLERYLAPRVFRFFGPGGGTREKIVGEMLISGSKTQSPTTIFTPALNGLTYSKTEIGHFKVNLPIQKTVVNSEGKEEIITGYIVQMEIDSNFEILTIIEDEPRYR